MARWTLLISALLLFMCLSFYPNSGLPGALEVEVCRMDFGPPWKMTPFNTDVNLVRSLGLLRWRVKVDSYDSTDTSDCEYNSELIVRWDKKKKALVIEEVIWYHLKFERRD